MTVYGWPWHYALMPLTCLLDIDVGWWCFLFEDVDIEHIMWFESHKLSTLTMIPLHSYMDVTLLKKHSCYYKGVLGGSWTWYMMTPLLVVTRTKKDLGLGTLHMIEMHLQVSLHPLHMMGLEYTLFVMICILGHCLWGLWHSCPMRCFYTYKPMVMAYVVEAHMSNVDAYGTPIGTYDVIWHFMY